MTTSLKETLRQIDLSIQRGDGASAQHELKELFKKPIPREHRSGVAALAWRVGLPQLGVQILNPLVRPSSRKPVEATADEKIEYAGCLVRIGAPEEAIELVRDIPSEKYPRALLIHAAANISQWNYTEARTHLSRYIRSRGVRPYDQLVAKVNLAEALIHEGQKNKAMFALGDLLHDASLRKLTLVYGKTLELYAQFSIEQHRFKEADDFLEKARAFLEKTNGTDIFFVSKWKAISRFLQSHGKGSSPKLLRELRQQASERGHWETLRDCDRIEATLTKDETLLRRLYFGTSLDSFRNRYLDNLKPRLVWGAEYVWQVGKGRAAKVGLDLTSNSPDLKGDLRPEGVLHRLLVILTSDFYRPFRVGSVFSRLHPGEYYDPATSPHRIHETFTRLRLFLSKNRKGLEIEESGGSYRLTSPAPFSIKVPLQSLTVSRESKLLTLIRSEWPGTQFSVTQISHELNCSPRKALSLVNAATDEGHLNKEGKGRATRYRLAK